jgi:predicted nucleic acid-binding protein
MPGSKIFLDTNIIIYAFDVSAGEKHEEARKIMAELWGAGRGLLSTQVLQEFFVSVTKKIPRTLSLKAAKEIVMDLLKWEVVVNDGESILEAVDIQSKQNFSFWDSLIIQAAIRGGASQLLSEDLSDGQTVRGVTIRNPFMNFDGLPE